MQTGVQRDYHIGNVVHLDNTDTRWADDFLHEAFLLMVPTSCDLVLVVTDTALVSENLSWFPVLPQKIDLEKLKFKRPEVVDRSKQKQKEMRKGFMKSTFLNWPKS